MNLKIIEKRKTENEIKQEEKQNLITEINQQIKYNLDIGKGSVIN